MLHIFPPGKKKKILVVFLILLMSMLAGIYVVRTTWGLRGRYYTNTNWEGEPRVVKRDKTPSLRGEEGYHLLSTHTFSVKWEGWIVITQPGVYEFATNSDDGSYLRIDGKLVVDNGGAHGLRKTMGELFLEKGSYRFEVLYFTIGGFSVIQTLWTPPNQSEEDISAEILFLKHPTGIDIMFRKGIMLFLGKLKIIGLILGVFLLVIFPIIVLIKVLRRNKLSFTLNRVQKQIKFILVYIVYLLLITEIVSRGFLAVTQKVPFFKPERIFYHFYPEIKEIKQTTIQKGDGYFDILVLGASVIAYCHLKHLLMEQLQTIPSSGAIRIHDVSVPAHGSPDSLYKYQFLLDKHFDVVVFYHAINELRANNCPDSVFKADYSHYNWYRDINLFSKHREIRYITFPYVFHFGLMQLREKLRPSEVISDKSMKPEWLKYGSTIKTVPSFESNLTKIVEIARMKGEQLLLMSFASYVADDYSRTKFENKELDYTTKNPGFPIELWGIPQNIILGISAHNKVIKDIGASHPDIDFLDMDSLIPKEGKYFIDICHFSEQGCREFTHYLSGPILEIMKQ